MSVVLEVLFVPRKAETLSVIRRAAETMDIHLQICTDPAEVERLLFCHRYDGLIVDHDESTETILRSLRQSPSSRGAIAIDIHEEHIDLQTVFGLGANFEMVSPLNADRVRRTLLLAAGLMMLGRRRYYRHPVDMPAEVVADGRQMDAKLSNVSENGVGLRCSGTSLSAGPLYCSFTIPKTKHRVSAHMTVVWADKTGQAGCHVDHFTEGAEHYADWVAGLFHRGPALRSSIANNLLNSKDDGLGVRL